MGVHPSIYAYEHCDEWPRARGDHREDRELRRRPAVFQKMMFTGPEVVISQLFRHYTEIKEISIDRLERTTPLRRIAEHHDKAKFYCAPLSGTR